jgi:hypothetical protein
MADNSITIKFEGDFKQKIEQSMRDVLILEFGEMWEEYCYENNISPNIKIGFLDHLNKKVDALNK